MIKPSRQSIRLFFTGIQRIVQESFLMTERDAGTATATDRTAMNQQLHHEDHAGACRRDIKGCLRFSAAR
jgi:hypothetical protein